MRNTAHGEVIERIKALLREQGLGPGDRLPSERTLAETLGVSRASVREAMKALTNLGVLQTRHGSGTVIADTSASLLTSSLEFLILFDRPSALELYEARELMEVFLVRRAAEHRTKEDVESLRDALAGLGDRDGYGVANARFHGAIAAAAKHRVVERMMASLEHAIRAAVEATRLVVTDPEASYEVHAQIVQAIADRNGDAAEAAMREHMRIATDELRRVLG